MPTNLGLIYSKNKKYLLKIANGIVGRKELADELVQEMFANLVTSNVQLTDTVPRKWLVKCLFYTYGRRKFNHKRTPERDWVYVPPRQIDDSMEEYVYSNSERNMIADKIACLPFDQAMLVNAVIYTNVKDAARVLNLDHDVTKQRYISYTKTLRSWLKGYYNNVYGGTSEGVRSNRRANRVGA